MNAMGVTALDLQEFDPVCPTCRAPWAGIERLVAELQALRRVEVAAEDVVALYPTTITHFREHPIVALADALDAARKR